MKEIAKEITLEEIRDFLETRKDEVFDIGSKSC